MTPTEVTARYRAAAIKLFGLSEAQAAQCIYTPKSDPGQWAPKAKCIINFEYGTLEPASYYAPRGMDKCFDWASAAGVGYIEYHNAAIAAVWV